MEQVEGLEIPRTLQDACHPQHLALLVYDMQIGILHQIEEGEAVTRRFAELMTAGASPTSPEAADAVRAHRDHISRWFYECTPRMQRGLAEMYVEDERFTQTYERVAPGLARYVHDAVLAETGTQG